MEKDNAFWQIILKALRSLRSLLSLIVILKNHSTVLSLVNKLVDIFYVFLK